MNKKLIIFLLSTSLFLTSCSQKPKQQHPSLVFPKQFSFEISLPPPSSEYQSLPSQPPLPPEHFPIQPQSLPAQPPQSQPSQAQHYHYQPLQSTQPRTIQSQPAKNSNSNSTSVIQQSPITLEAPKPDLEQILNKNYSETRKDLAILVEQYVIGLEDYQDTHKELMQDKSIQVYQNYLFLELAPLDLAYYSIKYETRMTSAQKQAYLSQTAEQVAKKYLSTSHELSPKTPINYLSDELIRSYTDWVLLRQSQDEKILRKSLEKARAYDSYKELLNDNFTRQDYEALMQQLIPAIEKNEQAFRDSRTGAKGAFAKGEIKSTAGFSSIFYPGTVTRYYNN